MVATTTHDARRGRQLRARRVRLGRHLRLECVVELGDPEASNLERSVSTAASICELSGGCSIPVAWPFSILALGIGALRDLDEDIQGACGVEPHSAI